MGERAIDGAAEGTRRTRRRAERSGTPPRIDDRAAVEYRRNMDKLFKQGAPADRKRLLRDCVQEVKLMPDTLEVAIRYRLPESVMNGLVAGGGFEPPTFGL